MNKKKKRRLLKTSLIIFAALIFILFVNLSSVGKLPPLLQKGADAVNAFSGGLLYRSEVKTVGIEVNFIDVGQGDSELISCGGENMLIDAGTPENGGKVKNFIFSKGIRKLDYVVATHPHNDHIGGMEEVLSNFPVKKLLLSPGETTTQGYENLLIEAKNKNIEAIEPQTGFKGNLGKAEFTVFSPEKNYDDLNDMSLIIKLTYKDNSFLFTGDAGEERERALLNAGEDISADVLKVGHHGSKTATSQAFLTKVHPSFAVISVGAGNSYGLPDNEVTQRLKGAEIYVLRTDLNGTVTFWGDGKKIQFKEEKYSGNIK